MTTEHKKISVQSSSEGDGQWVVRSRFNASSSTSDPFPNVGKAFDYAMTIREQILQAGEEVDLYLHKENGQVHLKVKSDYTPEPEVPAL